MNEADDRLLRAGLSGLSSDRDDGDWRDVVFRARRTRRRHVLAVAALTTVVVASVASAVALTRPTVDFSSAEKSPHDVVVDFGRQNVIAGMGGRAPGTLPDEARRITTVKVDGKDHTLYVAPTESGGFCWQWSNLVGSCRTSRTDELAKRLGAGGLAGPKGFSVIDGEFLLDDGARIVVSYADGTKGDIPFVWVTEPIAAGFYLYDVPDSHRRPDHDAVSVALLDADGKVLSRQVLPHDSEVALVGHRVPNFGTVLPSPLAVYEKRELLFDVALGPHRHLGLWVAPRRGGGTCFWSNSSSGCDTGQKQPALSPTFLAEHPELKDAGPLMSLGARGGNPVSFCCRVDKTVARVELRYQDGKRQSVTPKRGYLLLVLPPEHYAPGHRLQAIVAYDAAGKVIGRKPSSTDGRLYPCDKPKDIGYGVMACP